jgi:putative ABC transport system permease protein
LQELARVPGFQAVGFASTPPLIKQGDFEPHTVQAETQPLEDALRNPYVSSQSISENYFRLLGIPLRSGRFFNEFDNTNSEPVAIVSSRLAKRLWADQNPIGQRIRYDPSNSTPKSFRKVVGIVGDMQDQELGGPFGLQFYVPYRQEAEGNQYILIKTRLALREVRAVVERTLWGIDPEQSVFDFSTYDQRILDTVWQLRVSRTLLILFSGVALVLAAIGIYGVTSYLVGQRQREIGLRIALGASPRGIQTLILKRAVLVAMCGLVSGLAGAAILAPTLTHVLHRVNGNDPLVFGTALVMLFAIAMAASALPAWRASRVNPVITLRAE